MKPYLQLDRMIEAAFDTARRLFGLSFKERRDVPVYHPDVRVWEVTGEDGRHVGLFLGDYFARPSKRSGAWMSNFRNQEKLAGDIRPIVVNVMNFSKAADSEPALLTFDDARTLFHEFGHALHGLLSDVTYRMISGTNVSRDFVEFPSQLYEHWLEEPEVLSPLRAALPDRRADAGGDAEAPARGAHLQSGLCDGRVYVVGAGRSRVPSSRGRRSVDTNGVRARGADADRHAGGDRHAAPPDALSHIFSGDDYSSGYYSYMWSEVLDADGFAAFKEAGDIFDRETAKRLKDYVYSAGYLARAGGGLSPFPRACARPGGAAQEARAGRGAGDGRSVSHP